MAKKKGAPKGSTFGGTDGTTRRFNKSLAMMARDMVPAELLIEWHMAVLQGHDPKLVRSSRTASGWDVEWSETGEIAPSLDQKNASVLFLRQAGWGLPAQSHYIEADIRQRSDEVDVDLSEISQDPLLLARVVGALKHALAPQLPPPKNEEVEDAEIVSSSSEKSML